MSLLGLKKQINKANQYVSEKIGGAKGTELDEEFTEMEKKTDVLQRLAEELINRTHELLQPNPASRTKMLAAKSISKLRGQSIHSLYPQPEGQLADCMIKYGSDLGDDSLYGKALVEAGESYKQLADVKYSKEDNVKQNFIDPLQQLLNKDIKEVNFHRKKLQGRRLDYDCKKRKQVHSAGGAAAVDEEIHAAEEKFDESKLLTEIAMKNLLENDFEQVSQLCAFIEAELEYHQLSVDVLKTLSDSLHLKCQEAANRPHDIREVVRLTDDVIDNKSRNRGDRPEEDRKSVDGQSQDDGSRQPCAEALYDFDAENEGELGFKAGEIIELTARLDENWFQGTVRGQAGFFPINYVKVIVDLPTI